MELNPIAHKFIFDDNLFYFTDDFFVSSSSEEYFGKNNSKILILTNSKFGKEDFELFSKILAALKLTLDDIALIDYKHANIQEFIERIEPKKIILCGLTPFEIGLQEHVLNTYEIKDISTYNLLQAEKFNFYHTDASKKKALWFALQKLLA